MVGFLYTEVAKIKKPIVISLLRKIINLSIIIC